MNHEWYRTMASIQQRLLFVNVHFVNLILVKSVFVSLNFLLFVYLSLLWVCLTFTSSLWCHPFGNDYVHDQMGRHCEYWSLFFCLRVIASTECNSWRRFVSLWRFTVLVARRKDFLPDISNLLQIHHQWLEWRERKS